MFKSTDLYIDLGTANTLIYAKKYGFLFNEPSVLALKENSIQSNKIFAHGKCAKLMIGKAPLQLSVFKPLKEGVIADFDSTAKMLHGFINQIKGQLLWLRPRLIISLPCQITNYEKKAVEEIGYNLGARKVQLLHEPVAAAIGAGLPILANQGSMIVDIGGGTTEIAVISMGGIVTAQAVRVGGDNIDSAIISWLNTQYRIAIGEQTAERIKINIGSALPLNSSIEIGGLDMTNFLPRRFHITAEMISPAIENVVQEIIFSIRKTLEQCPPEISGDISRSGIVITGGGALLNGLAQRLAQEIGVPVSVADKPLFSVALGGAQALENNKLFDALEEPA